MCMGGSASAPPPPAPAPPPEPAKEPNRVFVNNRKRQYLAAGLPGTNLTGGLGVQASAPTKKTLLGV